MKRKSKAKRRTFSLNDEVYELAKRQAGKANRSISNYLATLVLADNGNHQKL